MEQSLTGCTIICRFKFELQLSRISAIFDADYDFYPSSELCHLLQNKSNQRCKMTVSMSWTEIKLNQCNHKAWTRETTKVFVLLWEGCNIQNSSSPHSFMWSKSNVFQLLTLNLIERFAIIIWKLFLMILIRFSWSQHSQTVLYRLVSSFDRRPLHLYSEHSVQIPLLHAIA